MTYPPLALIGRILLAFLFVMSGLAKILDPVAVASSFSTAGLPLPGVMVWVVAVFEIVASLAVVAGRYSRIAAAALAAFCVASAFVAHFDPSNPTEIIMFLKNLAIAGGLFLLVAGGPGKWSLDGRRV